MVKFSVLMSVYNKEKPEFLRRSLDSIFNQTLLPSEVVLVKDGPLTSELDAVISGFEIKHPELKVIPLEKNMGLGKALNKGMTACTYDYIARMDSDDICFPERFQKQISYIAMHPEIDVLGCWTQEFKTNADGEMELLSLKKFPQNAWDNFTYCTKRCPVEHPAVILKKSAVLSVGGYQHCPLFEDYHLWARMFVNGAIFCNLQEPLLYFQTSDAAMKRRGGWKYAVNEFCALKEFQKIGFLNRFQLFFAVVTRFPVRILPNVLRKMFYKNFLRG